MSYDRLPVKAQYTGLGPVEYDGFAFGIDGQEYLLEWDSAIVWEFAEACYDHIEIVTASLKRIVDQELVDDHDLDDGNLVIFTQAEEKYRQLAEDLIEEGFPHYYQSHPDGVTYETFIVASADLGQAMLEDWLIQNRQR